MDNSNRIGKDVIGTGLYLGIRIMPGTASNLLYELSLMSSYFPHLNNGLKFKFGIIFEKIQCSENVVLYVP